MRSIMTVAFLVIAAGASAGAAPGPARAQALAQRIGAVGDGVVQVRFASRDGVCGNGRGNIGSRGRTFYSQGSSTSDAASWRAWCEPGPVRVELTVQGGTVERTRVFVGGNDSSSAVHDLGIVPATNAAEYFLDLARRANSGRVGEEAILAAVLADSATPWPGLLSVVRDSAVPRATRAGATFWLSQAAAAVINNRSLFGERDDSARSDNEDVRAQAIFALSQQPHEEGVPALVRVARTNHDPQLRSKALFWLGQSGDPRATDLFEEILKGKNP
ncbi:MAG: HEAT repeat domain-containing protein [Gemmatimonadaceae bacterium]